MGQEQEEIPILAVGNDPRYAMQVEVREILEGKIPAKPGERVAFLIHSPSLFFWVNIGRKPEKFQGFIEGPFEFVVLRKETEDGDAVFDLRIEEVDRQDDGSPVDGGADGGR